MRLHSYVVARDFGFAPNPFYGFCTLATCKPKIRQSAKIGDWIVGTGSKVRGRDGYLVYVMRVMESTTFNDFWNDPRFQEKKPDLRGSKKQAFGDNIYHRVGNGQWRQIDSHHSHPHGVCNQHNVANDTQADRVLISTDFIYWGGNGPKIPGRFRDYEGHDICGKRGHKNKFPNEMVQSFVDWLRSLGEVGYRGAPLDWAISP